MTDKTRDELMSQAQVFASAWSLVGGRFDRGGCLDDAEEAKSELKTMIEEALAPQPDCRTCAHYRMGYCHSWVGYPANIESNCTNGDKYEAAPRVVLWRTE